MLSFPGALLFFMLLSAALTSLSRIEWLSISGLSAGLSGLESSKSSSMYSTYLFLISSFSNMILPDLLLIALLAVLVFLLYIALSLFFIKEMSLFVGFQVLHIDCSSIFLLFLCISSFLSCLFLCICNCLVCICASL